jgi:hypothetical protein
MSDYRSFVFIVGLSSMVGQDVLAETYPSTRSYYGIWAMVEGLFTTIVTSHPNDTQYCPLLATLNQTSQEITHPGTAPAEARLTAEF